MELPINEAIFWTDSTIVIQYIRNESTRFQTFISNRLALIRDASSSTQWKRHVPSELNPADYASRGLKPNDSEQLEHWLNGPSFLWKNESHWPIQPTDFPELSDNDKELKKKSHYVHSVIQGDTMYSLITRFSNWLHLQSSVAWLLRYKSYLLAQTNVSLSRNIECVWSS